SNHALPTLRLGDSRLTVLVSHLDENKTSCSDYFRNSLHFPLIDTSSAVKFEISRRARRELEQINQWWVANRDARDLFVRELADAERQLRTAPESEIWRKRGDQMIRRWLLPKTRYHLYYRYDATQEQLLVLAVWGANRGTTPRL
ncbi:MAG: type II toxin-antitoxin system RelE/ParE family toxin, partial [Proteobacteria bacterium]|nr:type II toxin-antitoxin system RelE/ParE family toxin [Pseudomonadota bacterium]